MREIKFRAWDGKNMYEWGFLEKRVFMGPPHSSQGNFETMQHMQFTGLKDKNGKEIYEGDILKNGLAENLIQRGYFLKAGIPPKVIFVINDIRNLPFWEGQELAEIEVIGNIYENLEVIARGKGSSQARYEDEINYDFGELDVEWYLEYLTKKGKENV